MICNRFCHPFHGFHIFYYQTRGFRLRPAGYAETGTPLAMDMSPTYVGYKFRSPAARQSQFIELITQTLEHAWPEHRVFERQVLLQLAPLHSRENVLLIVLNCIQQAAGDAGIRRHLVGALVAGVYISVAALEGVGIAQ